MTHTEYRYSLAAPIGDLRPGQSLALTWKAIASEVPGEPSPSTARLCAALAGPYPSVEVLKAAPVSARTCPISGPGLILATEAAEVDLRVGTPVDQRLLLPLSMSPGYYQLVSVTALGADTGNSMSSAGIVRVAAP